MRAWDRTRAGEGSERVTVRRLECNLGGQSAGWPKAVDGMGWAGRRQVTTPPSAAPRPCTSGVAVVRATARPLGVQAYPPQSRQQRWMRGSQVRAGGDVSGQRWANEVQHGRWRRGWQLIVRVLQRVCNAKARDENCARRGYVPQRLKDTGGRGAEEKRMESKHQNTREAEEEATEGAGGCEGGEKRGRWVG